MGRRKKVVVEHTDESEDLDTNESKKNRSVIDLDDDDDEGIDEEVLLKATTFNKDARKRLEELLELKREKKELEDFDDYLI